VEAPKEDRYFAPVKIISPLEFKKCAVWERGVHKEMLLGHSLKRMGLHDTGERVHPTGRGKKCEGGGKIIMTSCFSMVSHAWGTRKRHVYCFWGILARGRYRAIERGGWGFGPREKGSASGSSGTFYPKQK